MAKSNKAPVAMRAVIARANRRLAEEGLKLKTARGEAMRNDADYFLVDLKRKTVTPLKQDLESYCRKIGALADWEAIG